MILWMKFEFFPLAGGCSEGLELRSDFSDAHLNVLSIFLQFSPWGCSEGSKRVYELLYVSCIQVPRVLLPPFWCTCMTIVD